MSTIGHNRLTGQDLLERNLRSGMYRLGYDVLKVASIDRRLSRTHIQILGLIVMTMEHTGYATPDRSTMAAWAGVKPSRITNITVDLVNYGYISRVYIEDHTARVYTYGECIDHDQIIGQIMEFCNAMRPKSPLVGVEKSPLCMVESPPNIQESPLSKSESPLKPQEKPLPRVDLLISDDQKSDPSLYTKKEVEEKKEEREVAKATSATRLAPNDLLNEVAPPPAVVVKRFADRITFKPYDEKRAQVVSLEWLKKTSPPKISDSDLLDYTEYVIHMLYSGALPLTLKSGEERNVFNHFAGSFRIYDNKQTFTLFEQWRRGRQTEATTRAKRQRFEIEEEDIGEMPFDPRAV